MEEENGLTFGEICRVVFKRIWWVVGATALALIIMVLVTQLWYNKRTQTYSVQYDIVYPDSDSGKYPDGSDFLNADSISLETLTAVKGSNENFANIDVEKMVSNDDITIEGSSNRDESGSFVRTFKLKVVAKYFRSDKLAVEFMRAVSSYPINRVNSVIESKIYGVYFSAYDNAATYNERIDALLSQKNYVTESYNKLIGYGSTVEVNLASLGNVFTSQEQQLLRDEIATKLYVLNPEKYVAEYETTLKALEKQIAENENIIEALRRERDGKNSDGSGAAALAATSDKEFWNAYDAKIAEYVVLNETLQNQIKNIQATKTAVESYISEDGANYKAKTEFDAKLDKYRTEIEKATDTLKSVSKEIYLNNSRVIYSGNKVTLEGGMGTIVSALLGAVIGFIVSAAVVLIVDLPKYKRAKLAAQTADNAGGEGNGEGNKPEENSPADSNEEPKK